MNLLKNQDNLYTVIQRGFKGENDIFEQDIVSVFSKAFNYSIEWQTFMDIAEQESLDVIISNTTEAGLAYKKINFENVSTEGLYPGKLTAFLMHRFEMLGNLDKKLIILPCELIEENGKILKQFVFKHADDFNACEDFKNWLNEKCLFLNNLVDRIVPGYPREDEAFYFEKLGYKDSVMSMCEPYFLWAIEGDEKLDEILPLKASGLNVQWVESLSDTQLLKVRILNGSHTLITPRSILKGFNQVDDVVENDEMKAYLNETLQNEILPSIKNRTGNKDEFALTVLTRFRNPHIKHKLESISMNSVSKFKNRLWPTVKSYIEDNNKLPENIMIGLAGLLRFYQVEKTEQGYIGKDFNKNEYKVFDTPEVLEFMCEINSRFENKNEEYVRCVLSESKLWDEDLSQYLNIVEVVTKNLEMIEKQYVSIH
ncbi:MAG: tagaturonate reductase [Peptostreptococcaceae bacterium]